MNNYTATGRLAKDPELRELPDGTAVCEFPLAVEGLAYSNDKVGYIDVTCFGAGGAAAARVLTKGWLVAVDGRLQYNDWEPREGEKRRDWEVIGHVEFLAAPKGQGAQSSEQPEPAAAG
ncbi:MAG: single-stranded DNA-binding protein [Solirubrobacteraceae bacterium]